MTDEELEPAVQAIWDDLTDRRGIKWELRQCDQAIQSEIRSVWRRQLRAVAEASAKEVEMSDAKIRAVGEMLAEFVRDELAEGTPFDCSEFEELVVQKCVAAIRSRGERGRKP